MRSILWLTAAALVGVALPACGKDEPKPAAATPSGDAGADFSTAPMSLAAGEVADVAFTGGRAQARFATAGGERFVLVLASTKIEGEAATFSYAAALEADGEDTGAKKATGCALAPWQGAPAAAEKEPSGTAPAVGATRTVLAASGIGFKNVTVRAAAVGPRAIVWVDETPEHPATLEPAFVQEFLTDFEETILPRSRALFGMESDVDGDGRISLVFSPLTKDRAVAFFSGCDVAEVDGCGKGNAGEFLYLTPPADIAPPYNTPNAIKETLAHELGHLIHFNRKVLRNGLKTWPDGSYMIEGFGGFTQDVVGWQAGNLYVAKAGLDDIDQFSAGEVFGFLEKYDSKRDGVLRGGGYWLVRYLYDRGGGDALGASGIEDRGGPSFLRALLDSPKSITDGVAERASLADVTVDFYTALALSRGSKAGLTDPTNACYAFLPPTIDPKTNRQRGGDPRAEFHGQKMAGPKTQTLAAPDGNLRAGGVEYLTFEASGAGDLTVRVSTDDAALPRVRIARVK